MNIDVFIPALADPEVAAVTTVVRSAFVFEPPADLASHQDWGSLDAPSVEELAMLLSGKPGMVYSSGRGTATLAYGSPLGNALFWQATVVSHVAVPEDSQSLWELCRERCLTLPVAVPPGPWIVVEMLHQRVMVYSSLLQARRWTIAAMVLACNEA